MSKPAPDPMADQDAEKPAEKPAPGPLRLFADGVSPELVSLWAERLAAEVNGCETPLTAARAPDGSLALPGGDREGHDDSPAARHVLLLGNTNDQRLSQGLRAPFDACIDMTGMDPAWTEGAAESQGSSPAPGPSAAIRAGLTRPGLFVSLATVTAYRARLSTLLTDALIDRSILHGISLTDFKTALQEAIANAVIHGNLQIHSRWSPSLQSFSDYVNLLQDALCSPRAISRRIHLHISWQPETRPRLITCEIRDEGEGFLGGKPPGANPAAERGTAEHPAPHGRGIGIIRTLAESVSFSDQGRCTTITFVPQSPVTGAGS